jgi:hypothetical protein
LVNKTNHDVKITELINRKPCCGVVRIGKTVLHPADETDVEVTISARQEFGEIVHDTEVLTDPPQCEALILRTTATAYPPIQIDEMASGGKTVLLSSDGQKRVDFRVLSHGTSTQPPVDLDHMELQSTMKVEWTGLAEECPSRDNVRVVSRRFVALLNPGEPCGERRAEVLLKDGNVVRNRHIVNWEVRSPIAASTDMIVILPGKSDYQVVVQSRDQKVFRIVRIECKVSGVCGNVVNRAPDIRHTIGINSTSVSRPDGGRGVITVLTDHPAQERVDIPFVVLE